MKKMQNGFLALPVIAAIVVIVIVLAAGFVFVKQKNQKTAETTSSESSSETKTQSSNQTTVNEIESDIQGVNLESELPVDDLDQDINNLL
jgi:uncharacterized protein HemX